MGFDSGRSLRRWGTGRLMEMEERVPEGVPENLRAERLGARA